MDLNQRKAAFVQLGNILSLFAEKKEWPGYPSGINELEFNEINSIISGLSHHNGWFTEEQVRKALHEWSLALQEEKLNYWIQSCPELLQEKKPKLIAIIMAGNIPLVGFHDLISVLISGHQALLKLSSDDSVLLPYLLKFFVRTIAPDMEQNIFFASGKLSNFDAVIATGSDNSSRYFDYYFSKYPHIIRKNRTSVAILDGDETKSELNLLAHDVFDFFGLGCRNVSKVYLPIGFDLNRIFEAFYDFREIINHNKYANNYDYNKAIYLLNKVPLLENGFILLKEDESLNSPLGVLFYEFYSKRSELEEQLSLKSDQIQCIISRNHTFFGKSQSPELWDYADNINTLEFLTRL